MQTRNEREHYMSIAPEELNHRAMLCGCQLIRDQGDGVVRLYQCPKHEAAPALFSALAAVLENDSQGVFLDYDVVKNARAAIALATGK